MKRKFMLCRYPKNGFGKKNGMYYLLDVWGNKFDIENEYDKTVDERLYVVRINDSAYGVYSEISIDKLIERIENDTESKIVKW